MNSEASDKIPNSTPKYLNARKSIPKELWPIFEELVNDYRYFSTVRFGKDWVAYEIIADLVNAGWRHVNKKHEGIKKDDLNN